MPELLAPCGNISALKAAVYSGADAVYLGLQAFNARIKADNFSDENICNVTKFCHLYGVKVYITLNTSIKNSEIVKIDASILACKKAKVDAFIVSDFSVINKILELAPEIAIHISTQAGVCNLEGAKFFEKYGATRVVLARETELKDIINIKKNTSLEVEYFVHGALCVAFSGKCLFSSLVNGNSGNRGRCLQPCRLPYIEKSSKKEGYLLSTSDLCFAQRLKELADIGVDSFKIEGRLRSEEYVYRVVKTYREIIDNSYKVSKDNLETLSLAFNRGDFSQGYTFKTDEQKLMSVKVQGNIGKTIGNITQIIRKNNKNYYEICTNLELSKDDGFKLLDENGFEVWGGRINDFFYDRNKLYVNVPNARAGLVLRMTSSACEIVPKKIPVKIDLKIIKGKLSLKIYSKTASVEYAHNRILDNAISQGFDDEKLNKVFSRLGNTDFYVEKFSSVIDGDYFAPTAELNEVRRSAFIALETQILSNYDIQTRKPNITKNIVENKDLQENLQNLIAIEVQSVEQLSDFIVNNTDIIVYAPKIYSVQLSKKFVNTVNSFNSNAKIYLKLLPDANGSDVLVFRKILEQINGFYGILCDNFYAVELAEQYNLKIFGGLGLNIFNNELHNTINFQHFLASAELNLSEISEFTKKPFVFAHGFLPLMNLKYCPYKLLKNSSCEKCTCNDEISYIDRKNFEFKILRNKANRCYFTLYNSIKCDISSKCLNCDFNFYLIMLNYNCEQIENIIQAYRDKKPLRSDNFTYGHLFRGVE